MAFRLIYSLIISFSLTAASAGFSANQRGANKKDVASYHTVKGKKTLRSNQTKKVDSTNAQLLRFLSLVAAPAAIIGAAGGIVVGLAKSEPAKKYPVAAAAAAIPIAYAGVTGAYGVFYGDNKKTLPEQLITGLRWGAYGLARGLYLSGILTLGMKSRGFDAYLNRINYQEVLTGTLVPSSGATEEQKTVVYTIRTLFLALTTKTLADTYINPELFGIKEDDAEEEKEEETNEEEPSFAEKEVL